MPEIIQRLLGSTRFWAAVISIAVPILNRHFDLGLSVEEIIAIIVGPNAWSLGQSLRSSRAKTVAASAIVMCLSLAFMQSAEAKHPFRKLVNKTVDAGVYAVARTEVAVVNTVDIVSDKYQRALASAQYRAAHRIHGHVTHLELGGGVTQSGVGWASHDSNPMTCLGRRGERRGVVCAVVAGLDGFYATCLQ